MKAIPLGILDMSPVLEGVSVEEALQQSVRLAQMAEEQGYERFWLSEHHDMAGLACTAPEILITYIGAHTSTIRLGSGGVLLPHYSALKIAETFRMLSALYPGRIDLGIGRAPGGSAHASIALSGNYLEHVAQMPTLMKDLTHLLQNKYEIEGGEVYARPIPAQEPECWLLGTNIKSAGLAAEYGTGYVFGYFMSDNDGQKAIEHYREQYQATTLQPQPKVMMAISVICADTQTEAEQLYENWKSNSQAPGGSTDEIPSPIVASTENIIEQLQQLQTQYKADELLMICPLQTYDERIRVYQKIAEANQSDSSFSLL